MDTRGQMDKPRKIYVASSWRNTYQPLVVEHLRAVGHQVYDFRHPRGEGTHGFHWSDISTLYRSWTTEQYRDALGTAIAVGGFDNDWRAMQWADTGVLLLPCGRSAHLEAGYFVGAGKDLFILLTDPMEPELMYKMATDICLGIHELVGRLMR